MDNQKNDSTDGNGDRWSMLSTVCLAAFAGYLLTTPRGRRLCDAAIQLLDNFSFECARFVQASTRAQIAAANGWKAIADSLVASRPPVAIDPQGEAVFTMRQ